MRHRRQHRAGPLPKRSPTWRSRTHRQPRNLAAGPDPPGHPATAPDCRHLQVAIAGRLTLATYFACASPATSAPDEPPAPQRARGKPYLSALLNNSSPVAPSMSSLPRLPTRRLQPPSSSGSLSGLRPSRPHRYQTATGGCRGSHAPRSLLSGRYRPPLPLKRHQDQICIALADVIKNAWTLGGTTTRVPLARRRRPHIRLMSGVLIRLIWWSIGDSNP